MPDTVSPPPADDQRWQVGDRVVWPHSERATTGDLRRSVVVRSPGTVIAVDDMPGLPGVRVRFDGLANGAGECYATYAELEPENCDA